MFDQVFRWIGDSPVKTFIVLWVGGFIVRMAVWAVLPSNTTAQVALVQYGVSSFVMAVILAMLFAASTRK